MTDAEAVSEDPLEDHQRTAVPWGSPTPGRRGIERFSDLEAQ